MMLTIWFVLAIAVFATSVTAQIPRKRTGLAAADRRKWFKVLRWNSEDYLRDSLARYPNAGISFFRLGRGRTLVQIQIGQPAYQNEFIFAILDESNPSRAKTRLVRFTSYFDDGERGIGKFRTYDVTGIVEFNMKRKTLRVFYKGAGTGYCGSLTTYRFVGFRSSLVESRVRGCGNATDELPVEKWSRIRPF